MIIVAVNSITMAQAQLTEDDFPCNEFVMWHKRECLFIEGHCLILNKIHKKKNDGIETSYFYCQRRVELGCRKSARAVRGEGGKYQLVGYSGLHCPDCVPSSAYLAVRKVRAAIKARVLADPTERAGRVYASEVNKVRDELGKLVSNITREINVFCNR